MEEQQSTIQSRISYILEREGLTVSAFSQRSGISWQTLKNLINGRNLPSYDALVRIVQSVDWVDANWLLLGTEEVKEDNTQAFVSLLTRQEKDIERLTKSNEILYRDNSELTKKLLNLTQRSVASDEK